MCCMRVILYIHVYTTKAKKYPLLIDESVLAVRASAVLDALEANFSTLATLHEEAMKEGDASVITAITDRVGSHRNAVVNWSSKNNITVRGAGRKRSATDPLDDGNVRGGRRRCGSKELASSSREGLRSGGGSIEGGDRLKSVISEAGGGSSVPSEEDTGNGCSSVDSGDGDQKGVGITLEEAKDLVQKLMTFFSQ